MTMCMCACMWECVVLIGLFVVLRVGSVWMCVNMCGVCVCDSVVDV